MLVQVMELVTGGELFDKIVSKGNYTEKVGFFGRALTLATPCCVPHGADLMHDCLCSAITGRSDHDENPLRCARLSAQSEHSPP